jgi:hypothetical protein
VVKFQAEQPVVGAKYRQPEPFGNAQGDPLVAAAAQGGRRAGLVGDAAVATANTSSWMSLSKTTRSSMRRRWPPSG